MGEEGILENEGIIWEIIYIAAIFFHLVILWAQNIMPVRLEKGIMKSINNLFLIIGLNFVTFCFGPKEYSLRKNINQVKKKKKISCSSLKSLPFLGIHF